MTPPKVRPLPPFESDDDILEIDLKLSSSESESDSEKRDTTLRKRPTCSTGKSRLNFSTLEKIKPSSLKKGNHPIAKKFSHGVKRQQPFVWPKIDVPPKRVPSPTFARFNPGLVCPSTTVSPPPNIIINNYYGTSSRQFKPQCIDPARMSRGQFKRFTKRSTQTQINEALAIRNALKDTKNYHI